jgi:hypothetical protein
VAASKRRIFWDTSFWTASAIALVGLAAAVARGVAQGRTGPAAVFALVWFAAENYVALVRWAIRRRARRRPAPPVPQGAQQVTPTWISLQFTFQAVAIGAVGGMGAALIGFPRVGIGIVLAAAAVGWRWRRG